MGYVERMLRVHVGKVYREVRRCVDSLVDRSIDR